MDKKKALLIINVKKIYRKIKKIKIKEDRRKKERFI
jgi:hypothetical protein